MLAHLLAAIAYAPSILVAFLALEFFMGEHKEAAMPYGELYYPLSPSISSMGLAAKLNHRLKENLAQASGLYVIGGKYFENRKEHSGTLLADNFSQKELIEESGVFLSAVKNSSDLFFKIILHRHSQEIVSGKGFSALIFKSKTEISAILHLKIHEDSEYTFYKTTLLTGTNLSEKLEYKCCLRKNEAYWALAPGAEHFWSEPEDPSTKPQEIGVCMVLPDPYLTPGKGEKIFSRFTYFEDVQR
tara:strand:+ start:1931 stop:2662 length:732 start_codon:yes stop_codon:yes gene_type:complete